MTKAETPNETTIVDGGEEFRKFWDDYESQFPSDFVSSAAPEGPSFKMCMVLAFLAGQKSSYRLILKKMSLKNPKDLLHG